MPKKRVGLFIDEKTFKEFQEYCKKHAYRISGKVELLLRTELKKNPQANLTLNQFMDSTKKEEINSVKDSKPSFTTPEKIVKSIISRSNSSKPVNPKVVGEGKAPSIDFLRRMKGL